MTSFKAQLLWDNIMRQDLSAVHSMLESGHINLEERDANGCTFLMVASEQGALSIVRELLQAGVDPNAVDNDNWNALLCASKEGHLEVVMELLEKNVNIEHADMCGWTPLMWACYKGHTYVANELLDRGSNPNVKADHNMTCLAWAAGRGHTEIVKMLIDKGAKVNMPDKYGTTPLIWACRKGHTDIVDALIGEGSSVDVAGMNSWTPLLVATKGGHFDCVRSVLSQDPNVNATDKDGLTSLAIAAREGYFEIVNDLLSKGAYVNLADKNSDTILIHAVKGGHVDIVRALLKKYVDVDVPGQDGKTALYTAVEKGYTEIVRLLLLSNPDLELCTKDDDTPLLRAVRMRNEECVRLLLEKGAKVSASDKRGDTALHIAIRARSKRITELLLRNPRHSRLLYRMNKAGESPYSMDTYHQRGILPQIYGHGNLNATDAENLLGYDIYSSALADILSEPCLITPITMGLYAKWGSGKSFLLDKLRVEMNSFTQQNNQAELSFSWLLVILFVLINSVIGETLGLALGWQIGLGIGLGLLPVEYGFLGMIIFITAKYDFAAINGISATLGRKQRLLTLLLKMLFCIPKHKQLADKQSGGIFSVRFLFSDCTRLTSVGGEKSLAAMIGTLCDAAEREYGILIARLFRVFKPHHAKTRSSHFKSVCCIPYFIIFLLLMAGTQVGIGLAIGHGLKKSVVVDAVLIALASVVGLAVVANMYTWGQGLMALVFSQRRRVTRSAEHIDDLKMDGFMQHLKREVDLMSKMVNCMDSFTHDQTRLVVIVDGLDSCEQDKVLQVLDTVKSLFSDDGAPFVTILAVDPHIIIKGIEQNLRTSFQDTNVNGFDYLRNVVHLPFYLQSQGMRIQQVEPLPSLHETGDASPGKTQRQDSVLTSVSSDTRQGRKASRTFGSTHVVGGSLSGSLPGMIYASSFDLTTTLAKNDYFSDINPRSMRRLMNIVAVTARLLRAYNIDFKWHRLAAWINLTEQWPYRLSWIIYYFEEAEFVENSASLYSLYKRILARIPATKEQDPLLEIDRNVRKLEASLTSKSGNFPLLNVADLKKFLPCTINLDPYLRKLIRETQHNLERHQAEMATLGGVFPPPPPPPSSGNLIRDPSHERQGLLSSPGRYNVNLHHQHQPLMYGMYGPQSMMAYPGGLPNPHYMPTILQAQQAMMTQQQTVNLPGAGVTSAPAFKHPKDFFTNYTQPVILSDCSVEDICDLLVRLKGLSPSYIKQYQASIRENNVSGLVLTMCDLAELQPVINMRFGDWQLFRNAVNSLISAESQQTVIQEENISDKADTSLNVQNVPTSQSNTAVSYSEAFSSPSTRRNCGSRSVSMQESGSIRYTPELQKIRERKMRRNDSIVEQLTYETAILKSAVSGFVEESEDEDEYEEDGRMSVLERLDELEGENLGEEIDRDSTRGMFVIGDDSHPSSPDSKAASPESGGLTFTISNSRETLDHIADSLSSTPQLGTSPNVYRPQLISSGPEQTKSDTYLPSDPLSKLLFSSHKDFKQPLSLNDIAPYITVLDGPKKCLGGQGSGEFVPLLGSIQLHPSPPSSSEFVPSSKYPSSGSKYPSSGSKYPSSDSKYPSSDSKYPSRALDLQLNMQVCSEPDIPASTSSDISAMQGMYSASSSHDQQFQPLQQSITRTIASSVPDIISPGCSVVLPHYSQDPLPHLSRALAIDKSDSETTSEADQSSPSKQPLQTISTSLERLTRPILGHFRQHFQQSSVDDNRRGSLTSHMVSFDSEPLIEMDTRVLHEDLPEREDFVQHSYSTIVEMSAAAHEPEGHSDFHHDLGVAFANMDQLPDSEHSSPDRETNV